MKITLIFLSVIFILLTFKFRHYNSPYKLIMVFGKKGSGKTTFLVSQAFKYHKKKYTVYTNIQDLNLPWIRHFDVSDLGKFVPVENSVLLVDEAGTIYDNRKFKSFSDETRDFFKLQRHYKCIVFLASQSYDVDKKLRDLTDDMILCQSFLPWLAFRRPIRRKITLTEASSFGESRIADNLKFAFPTSWRFTFIPKYAKYFDSFRVDQKPEIPYYEQDQVK